MRPALAALALPALLAACDIGTTSPGGLPASARIDGNTVTLDFGGGTCAVSPEVATGLADSFSVRVPASCPGVVEVGVARLSGPDLHVVRIVPSVLGPLAATGQAPGLSGIEVTVMIRGGAIGGYVWAP